MYDIHRCIPYDCSSANEATQKYMGKFKPVSNQNKITNIMIHVHNSYRCAIKPLILVAPDVSGLPSNL